MDEPIVRRGFSASDGRCSFCGFPATHKDANPVMRTDCNGCCGSYRIEAFAHDRLAHLELPLEKWAAISYEVRRISERNGPPLTRQSISEMVEHAVLPRPNEALDGLVLWIGEHSRWPGEAFTLQYPEFGAVIGAANQGVFDYYLDWLHATGFVEGHRSRTSVGLALLDARLTPRGWERYRELTSTGIYSKQAFMAMKFGDKDLDRVFQDTFGPAVARAGFKLRRAIDEQEAGLIDHQMEVRIRTARFVVCDLTHGNRGAYWEAGFAAGLGKPVFYTCRATEFDNTDNEKRPHFDTNHHTTVKWNSENLPAAAAELTAKIRSTLPGEAQLEDND